MAKPVVVVTRKLPDAVEARLSALFDAKLNGDDQEMTGDDIKAATATSTAGPAQVLVPTVTDTIDEAVISALPDGLGLIANFGVGVNHIDLHAAHKRGIKVTNTPGVLTDDTADLTMALLLAVPRRLVEGERLARSGGWRGWTPTFMVGLRATGKRLGIIGMGRIGQAVARRARGFGMAIHYHNRNPVAPELEAELGARYWPSLDHMLGEVDMVSVNCPLSDDTYHLLSGERLDLLAPHAVVVNTARGGIVDEAALAERLSTGRLAGAGLDVYEHEPTIHPRLLILDNVVLVPHLGSATDEGRIAMGEKVIENIKAFAAGEAPPDALVSGKDF
jgi:glyoxylate reductase